MLLLHLAAAARQQARSDVQRSVFHCSGTLTGACARSEPASPTLHPARPHSSSPRTLVKNLEMEERVTEDREGGCFGAWGASRVGALQRRSSRGRSARACASAAPRPSSARRADDKRACKAAGDAGVAQGPPLLWGRVQPRARTLTWSGRRVDEFERSALARKSAPLGSEHVAALVGRVLQSARPPPAASAS